MAYFFYLPRVTFRPFGSKSAYIDLLSPLYPKNYLLVLFYILIACLSFSQVAANKHKREDRDTAVINIDNNGYDIYVYA